MPRAEDAFGVHEKLATYSLAPEHSSGGPKARRFAVLLDIGVNDVDYLAAALARGILESPVRAVRPNPPHGLLCEVRVRVEGLRSRRDSVASVTTSWAISREQAPPRLVTAYIKS